MEKSDGGPAFPLDEKICSCGLVKERTGRFYEGMSLRDWFAGMALSSGKIEPVQDFTVVETVYRIADAILRERKKK